MKIKVRPGMPGYKAEAEDLEDLSDRRARLSGGGLLEIHSDDYYAYLLHEGWEGGAAFADKESWEIPLRKTEIQWVIHRLSKILINIKD